MSSLVKSPRLGHIHGMLRCLASIFLLLFLTSLPAAPLKLASLKAGSKTYNNVTVLGANVTDLYFMHDHGITNIKLKSLDPKLQRKFNYDPVAAAEAERQQAIDDALYQDALASNLVAEAERAILAKKKAAATSEESLADPISDSSPLGKPAPALEVEKWMGQKPVLEGQFVLITFWAPWSIPCRKYIPELNSLQRKFGDKLAVVGLTSDSEAEVEAMVEPRMDFASAIDTKSRMSAALGVSSIPCVLLLDPKRIVRYLGHPSALNEARLQSILAKPLP